SPSFAYLSRVLVNATATTAIYTLSLHDALPICHGKESDVEGERLDGGRARRHLRGHVLLVTAEQTALLLEGAVLDLGDDLGASRSEEHTSELQSRFDLVCRLLLEQKKNQTTRQT